MASFAVGTEASSMGAPPKRSGLAPSRRGFVAMVPSVDTERVRLGMLGPLAVTVGSDLRSVMGLRRKAVLALLGLHMGEAVSVERLVNVVWNGAAPATARNTLQSHISYLRRTFSLHQAIVARSPGYMLDLETGVTDVQTAADLIRQGTQSTSPHESASKLSSALALWRGPSLGDVIELPYFEEQGARLDRLRESAIAALVECRLALGEHQQVVPQLEDLVREHPFEEHLHGLLMRALYRVGRQTDALAVFRRLRGSLGDELGIDPGPAVRELEMAILRQDASLDLPAVAGKITKQVEKLSLPSRTVGMRDGVGQIDVGRGQAQMIEHALTRARDDQSGSVLLLDRATGVSRMSLLDRTRLHARTMGIAVLQARGIELEQDYAWGCVRQLLEARVQGSNRAAVTRPDHRSDLALALLNDGELPDDACASREYRLIRSLFWLVNSLTEAGPLLILLDDLKWCDVPSARFLAYVCERVQDLPVIVLAAERGASTRMKHVISALTRATRSTVGQLSGPAAGDANELSNMNGVEYGRHLSLVTTR